MRTTDTSEKLAGKLDALREAFRDDYARELNTSAVHAALDFARRHSEPDTVSADETGSVYFGYTAHSLSVCFTTRGNTVWAARVGGRYPHGEGDPPFALRGAQ